MTQNRREFLIRAAAASATLAAPVERTQARHVVLLGDSIFDNGRYVPGKPDVIQQLGAEFGERARTTLLARDGATSVAVAAQLQRLPADATHLVVSVGGNDALRHRDLLHQPMQNSADLLAELARIHAAFRADYAQMLAAVLARGKPTVVCTVYDSNFEAAQKPLADVALSVFNDAILRCAGEAGVPVLDLRRIFRARADYANAIEPSVTGGAKMVQAIVRVVEGHDFATRRTVLWA